jgi:hypothetical protein
MTKRSLLFAVCVLVGGCGSVTAASSSDAGDGAALEAPAAAGDVAGELGQVDAGGAELAPETAPELAPADSKLACVQAFVDHGYRYSSSTGLMSSSCASCASADVAECKRRIDAVLAARPSVIHRSSFNVTDTAGTCAADAIGTACGELPND